jgi:two-component system response regulator YesN
MRLLFSGSLSHECGVIGVAYRLVIIDDEDETRQGLTELIQGNDLGVEIAGQASDGMSGLELCRKVAPRIALLDVRMPRMAGTDCAAALRKEDPALKIIFMSGYTDKEYLKTAIHVSAIDYVEKPFNDSELFDVLRRAVLMCMEDDVRRIRENELSESHLIALELAHGNYRGMLARFGNEAVPAHTWHVCAILDFNTSLCEGMENFVFLRAAKIRSIAERAFGERQLGAHVSVTANGKAVIAAHGSRAKDHSAVFGAIAELVEKLKAELGYSLPITGVIGSTEFGAENAAQSYKNAKKALSAKFLRGCAGVYCYDASMDKPVSRDDLRALFDRCSRLENGDEFLAETARHIREGGYPDIPCIKDLYLEYLVKQQASAEKAGVALSAESSQSSLWEGITRLETLDEIVRLAKGKMSLLCRQSQEMEGKSGKVRSVIKHIRLKYAEDLSIQRIAEAHGLSPNYLSRLFKKETDMTINGYIEQVRVERAKELLANDRMKMMEVAERVGYHNPNYFATVFRKLTGVLPSEFRKAGRL